MRKLAAKTFTMRLSIFFLLGIFISACSGLQKQRADVILHNGTFYPLTDANITQEAMAIKDGKILAIGAEHEILNKYQSTETVDLKKQFVYPGFIDGHCHFLAYGQGLNEVNLTGTQSWEECLTKIEEFANTNSSAWITGIGWDQNDWENKTMPTNEQLNSLFPDTPVLIKRIDGHAAIANKKALNIANINANTTVNGGEILLIEDQPSGVLIDNAVDLVTQFIPEPNEEDLTKALLMAQEKCFEVGLTSVADAGLNQNEIELINSLHQDSALFMDMYAMISNTPENLAHYLASGPVRTSKLTVNSVKVYADGALGSRGALLKQPYTDAHHHQGFYLTPPNEMDSLAEILVEKGFQMNTHCIGDSANRKILEIYAKHLNGTNDKRWRIEHAQVVTPADLAYFKNNTIIPSVQPTHATSDMYWAEDRLGERVKHGYTNKDLLNQNHIIALGTDFPIEGIDPLKTFYAAVFRTDSTGYPENGFNPENALTAEEALRGMTIWNAIANFEEDSKGTLEIGKKANITITNMDLMNVRQADFKKVKVTYTIVDGIIVYRSAS
jgi:predicted amidohydrolase YtcJ